MKKVRIHPPSGTHILLPDGRRMAYREQGVPSDRARYSFIAPHGFLSSRLAGIWLLKMLNTWRNEINESLACAHGKIWCKNECNCIDE